MSTLPKDIIAAVSQHFASALGEVPLVFEGEVPDAEDAELWVEFRRDGPHFQLLSKDYHLVTLTVDLAIMELIGSSSNIYNVDNIVGALLPYFDDIIIPDLGCMRRSTRLRVHPLGRLGRDSLVKQTTMEATFTFELKGTLYGTA